MSIAQLISSIIYLATTIPTVSKTDIMFEYNSNAEVFHLRIFKQGWEANADPDEYYQLWLDEGEKISKEKLEKLQGRLIAIYNSINKEVA